VNEVVLVVREGQQATFEELAARYNFRKPHKTVVGGAERQDSVWNGLQALSSEVDTVAIHDGARPCTSARVITATLEAARQNGAAVTAQRMGDTVKQSDDGLFISRHLERSKLWAVQTPQCFRVDVIRRALSLVRERGMQVTDDTAACDLLGQAVVLIETDTPNPKVTVPADLPYVELLLRSSKES
jgi:2-C-methyl-D-erythritol 4-phosphate cytidylyltransferase